MTIILSGASLGVYVGITTPVTLGASSPEHVLKTLRRLLLLFFILLPMYTAHTP